MVERRRRTMGERGAAPDPLNSGLYCRHCHSKYCSCDGYGNVGDGWGDDEWGAGYQEDDPWANDPGGGHTETDKSDSAETESPEPEKSESEGLSVGNAVAIGVGVAGAAAVIGTLGAAVGIPVAVGALVGGAALGRLFGR
jgi:hypothetical protein